MKEGAYKYSLQALQWPIAESLIVQYGMVT